MLGEYAEMSVQPHSFPVRNSSSHDRTFTTALGGGFEDQSANQAKTAQSAPQLASKVKALVKEGEGAGTSFESSPSLKAKAKGGEEKGGTDRTSDRGPGVLRSKPLLSIPALALFSGWNPAPGSDSAVYAPVCWSEGAKADRSALVIYDIEISPVW